jgi:hypothetical protein
MFQLSGCGISLTNPHGEKTKVLLRGTSFNPAVFTDGTATDAEADAGAAEAEAVAGAADGDAVAAAVAGAAVAVAGAAVAVAGAAVGAAAEGAVVAAGVLLHADAINATTARPDSSLAAVRCRMRDVRADP